MLTPKKLPPFFSLDLSLFNNKMSKVGKALAVSFGALAGGAAGFYVLEMYKIKSKASSTIFVHAQEPT
jgi:hypothetical protein